MTYQVEIEALFSTMMQLRKLMAQRAEESHEQRAATMLQFSALHFLIDNKKGTVKELAQFLNLSKSSATQLVERLAKADYVIRLEDAEDRRITRLNITQSGKEKAEELKEKIKLKMSKIFSKIEKKDIQELIRIQTQLIDILKKEPYE